MTLEEQKVVEDHIERLLGDLTRGEKAVLYKTLYALGLRIADCDTLIRREPAPAYTRERKGTAPLVHLARGLPPSKFP